MSTSRRSTSRWSNAAALALAAVLAAGSAGAPPPANVSPFLRLFQDRPGAPLAARDVTIDSAAGHVPGYLVRLDTAERLPAILVVPGQEGLSDWVKESARDLAEVGYVTLAIELPRDRAQTGDEPALARLGAGVRWLRRRPDVLPERVGVAGWGEGAGQALALAASTPVQACVVCDGAVSADRAALAGLGRTPVLGLFAGRGEAAPAFRTALAEARLPHKLEVYEAAGPGFLGPPGQPGYSRQAADRAWVEVYEFLGKYVEDAPLNPPVLTPAGPKAVATIADLMRSVNEPAGVRGSLLRDLEQEPGTARQWERVRANAALVAEAGQLLQERTPPRGSPEHWSAETAAYTAVAEQLVGAADRRDYAAARHGLEALGTRCASCHNRHR